MSADNFKIALPLSPDEIDSCKRAWSQKLAGALMRIVKGNSNSEALFIEMQACAMALDMLSRSESPGKDKVAEIRKAGETPAATGPRPSTGPFAPSPGEVKKEAQAFKNLPPPQA